MIATCAKPAAATPQPTLGEFRRAAYLGQVQYLFNRRVNL